MGADNDLPVDGRATEQADGPPDAMAGNETPGIGPVIHFNLDGVPAELRECANWVAWTVKPPARPGAKFGKVPINPRTGGKASSTNPKTWGTLAKSFVRATTNKLGGVGFMFSSSPYTGIDLDHCRDPESGVIEAWAREIIRKFDTYTEVSPSGTGVHLIVKAKLSGKGRKVKNVEIYDSGRFFTITGVLVAGSAAAIAEGQAQAEELCVRLEAERGSERQSSRAKAEPSGSEEEFGGQSPNDLSDAVLLERAKNAKNGHKFEALWRGDISGHPSHSEADLALCSKLAFWTGPDPARIDHLFRLSGLMRDKWNEMHGAQTYGAATIERAVSGKTEFYRSSGSGCTLPDDQPPERALTDTGNAERLVEVIAGTLRYCYAWNKWMSWNDGHWNRDQAGTATLQSKAVVGRLFEEAARAPDGHREAIAKWALSSQKVDRRRAMVELAKCEPAVPVRPAWFDRNLYLLNCANGTLDLLALELREHRRDDFITKLCPTRFTPGAACPKWIKFLERVLPDDEVRDYVHRLVGYGLTGDVSEQMLAFLIGDGANGKSTFARVIQGILAECYAIQIASDLLVAKGQRNHPTEVADLFGVRMAFGVETDMSQFLDEALVKQLTGGDRIRARRMREDFWEFDPTHKIFLLTNHMPGVRGREHAIWRRLHVVRFEVTIPPAERNRSLFKELMEEREGILAWMVEGCRLWRERGLDAPDSVLLRASSIARERTSDEVFVDTRVVRAVGARLGATDAYQAYCKWCEANDHRPATQQQFGAAMGGFGYGRKKSDGRMLYLDAALVRDDQGREGPPAALNSPVPLANEANAASSPCGPSSSLMPWADRPVGGCTACGGTRHWHVIPDGPWTCGRCHSPAVGAVNVEWNEPEDVARATRPDA